MTDQANVEGTTERPAAAGIRFSLSEAKGRLKPYRVLQHLHDDEGHLAKFSLPIDVELTSDEAAQLPEVGPSVLESMKVGTTIPEAAKNTFTHGIGREFAGAKYRLAGKPGRIEFNGMIDGRPTVKVVKGIATLSVKLVATMRFADFETLTRYLSEPAKLTVEPPQQELDLEAGAN